MRVVSASALDFFCVSQVKHFMQMMIEGWKKCKLLPSIQNAARRKYLKMYKGRFALAAASGNKREKTREV